jgi:hypothetical protein
MSNEIEQETDEQMSVRLKHSEDAVNGLPVLEGVKMISYTLGNVLRNVPKAHRAKLALLCRNAALEYANSDEESEDAIERIQRKIATLNDDQKKIIFDVIDMMEKI